MIYVTKAAYMGWPEKYRPKVDEHDFKKIDWNKWTVFGGFGDEDGELCGYAQLNDCGSFVEFNVLRTIPEKEKMGINAAMVAGILDYYKSRFDGQFYVNDGSRSIRHETAFQDYLEKYFDFRKAYCKLNVKYKRGMGFVISCLFPFRELLKGSQISSLLKMEELRRG